MARETIVQYSNTNAAQYYSCTIQHQYSILLFYSNNVVQHYYISEAVVQKLHIVQEHFKRGRKALFRTEKAGESLATQDFLKVAVLLSCNGTKI